MAECIVCGEKIEDGKKFCSVCEPEHHNLPVEDAKIMPAEIKEVDAIEGQESKIEIKKDKLIVEDDEK